jgi:non-heme chloroperoxidase
VPLIKVGEENNHDIKIKYDDLGSGKPVILVHAWPLDGSTWEYQVDALLSEGYRVVTYDRRGFGSSSRPMSGYDYDTFASDLNCLIRELDLTDVALVGYSMGGGEVARYISRYGTSRISRAVLASSIVPYMYKSPDNSDGLLDEEFLSGIEFALKADRPAFLESFIEGFFNVSGKLVVSQALRDYVLGRALTASSHATSACVAAFGRTDFRADLAKFDIPTLLLHGDSDAGVPFEETGRKSADLIASSRVVIVPGAPHGVALSHSSEFNAALLEFLAG